MHWDAAKNIIAEIEDFNNLSQRCPGEFILCLSSNIDQRNMSFFICSKNRLIIFLSLFKFP